MRSAAPVIADGRLRFMPQAASSTVEFNASEYWRDRLASDPSLTGVGTRPFGAAYQRYLYRLKEAAIHRVLRIGRASVAGAKVLNVGCGVGYFELFFDRLGAARVTGVDVAASSIERLRRRHPQYEYHVADVGLPLWAPLVGRSFDLVTAIDVLYHIVDDERFETAIANLCGLCDRGGLLLFTESPRATVGDALPHVRHRSPERYRAMLADHGMRIVARTPMYHFFDRPIRGMSLLAMYPNVSFPLMYAVDRTLARWGFNRGANYCAIAMRM